MYSSKRVTQIKKTKAILFCSPSNPTGTVFPEKDLRVLADIALNNDLMIITDEAYEYFIFDDEKHFSIAAMPEMKKHVISNYTFTKTYAMTEWMHTSAFKDRRLTRFRKDENLPGLYTLFFRSGFARRTNRYTG